MAEAEPQRVTIEEGVVYGRADGGDLTCDVFTPPPGDGPRPAILMLHGGGWESGDPSMMRGYAILMGRRGYCCISSRYRLTGQADWPAQIEDARAALRWVREEHTSLGIDPDRIVVWGQSAGGHLGLLVAGSGAARLLDGEAGAEAAPPTIAAVVAFYPITTIEPEMGSAWERYAHAIVDPDAPAELRQRMSPLSYVDERFPPTLLMHGAVDELVAPEQSVLFYDALRKAGVPAGLHLFAGQPHGYDLNRELALQSADIAELFLDRYLGGEPGASGG